MAQLSRCHSTLARASARHRCDVAGRPRDRNTKLVAKIKKTKERMKTEKRSKVKSQKGKEKGHKKGLEPIVEVAAE